MTPWASGATAPAGRFWIENSPTPALIGAPVLQSLTLMVNQKLGGIAATGAAASQSIAKTPTNPTSARLTNPISRAGRIVTRRSAKLDSNGQPLRPATRRAAGYCFRLRRLPGPQAPAHQRRSARSQRPVAIQPGRFRE